MIVCVCQSVSDREIRAAIRNGAMSLEQLQLELGVAACCGKCADTVYDVLIQEQSSIQSEAAPIACCREAA
jgi:bacterioferritin-associated ferredoxin